MEANLMDYLESFRKILQRERDSISQLLKMENQKYEALKQVDVKKLMDVNTLEEEVLQYMENIELKRKEVLLKVTRALGIDPELSLSDIVSRLPDGELSSFKKELMGLRESIRAQTDNLRVTLKENSEMIQTNLEIINLTLNFANRNSIKDTYNYRDKKEPGDSIFIVNQIA